MDLGTLLFGQEPKAETGREMVWTPEQMKLMKQWMPWLGETGAGEEYPDQLPGSAPMSSLEQLSLSGLEEMVGKGGLGAQVQETLSGMLEGGPEDFEEYYRSTVRDPMMKEFTEETMPAISRGYAPSGFWSGERVRTEERSREDLLESLTRGRGKLAYEARESGLNRALAAAGLAPQVAGMYGGALEAGGIPRAAEEARIGGEYNEWMRQQGVPFQKAQLMLQMLGQKPYEPYAVGLPGQSGMFQEFAHGFGQGMGSASDRRLKKNVLYLEPIGDVKPVLFQFIWEDEQQLHLGVIAQDLLEVHPELVGTMNFSGADFLTVDYAGLNQMMGGVM